LQKTENIEISDENIDEKLAEMAKSYDMEVEKLKELVGEARETADERRYGCSGSN